MIALLLFLIGGVSVSALPSPSLQGRSLAYHASTVPGIGGELSPVNPEYIEYFEDRFNNSGAERHYTTGYIPAPIDLSHTAGTSIQEDGTTADDDQGSNLRRFQSTATVTTGRASPVTEMPSRYDLRFQGRAPPVRDQGLCSCCWVFSSLSSLESTLLGQESWNFSENNMKNTHGFDYSPCEGGNPVMATAYLARWSGPVSSRDDPYVDSSGISPSSLKALKHVQNVYFLPPRTDPLDNTNIKYALTHYGAVTTAVSWADDCYSPLSASFYNPTVENPNHAVTIVGWDDSYPAGNFLTNPPGNGAFLVQNSWGTEWGDKGYFYISYYDPQVGRSNSVFTGETLTNYDRIYQYDPLGWVLNIGLGGENASFANVFTAEADGVIAAVGFYTPASQSRYEASVRTDTVDGPMGGSSPQGITHGVIGSAGYHTIPLYPAVKVQKGQKFTVIVTLTTPGYLYPVAVEYPLQGFSMGATASRGQSYVSSDGSSWTDMTDIYANTNVCLKAFQRDTGSLSQKTYTPASQVEGLSPSSSPTTSLGGQGWGGQDHNLSTLQSSLSVFRPVTLTPVTPIFPVGREWMTNTGQFGPISSPVIPISPFLGQPSQSSFLRATPVIPSLLGPQVTPTPSILA